LTIFFFFVFLVPIKVRTTKDTNKGGMI